MIVRIMLPNGSIELDLQGGYFRCNKAGTLKIYNADGNRLALYPRGKWTGIVLCQDEKEKAK